MCVYTLISNLNFFCLGGGGGGKDIGISFKVSMQKQGKSLVAAMAVDDKEACGVVEEG